MAVQGRSGALRKITRVAFPAALLAAIAVFALAGPASAAGAGAAGSVCQGDDCAQNLITLTKGLMWYALMACVAGILVSSILWAMGSKGQNPGTELAGKRGLIVCCTAAFFLGALPAWITTLSNMANAMR